MAIPSKSETFKDEFLDFTAPEKKNAGYYEVEMKCLNCGYENRGRFTKGTETGAGRKCPVCETANLKRNV